MLQRREVELGLGEDLGRRQKGELGAGERLAVAGHRRVADDGERRLRVAHPEAHEVFSAAPPDAQVEALGQRVDHRDADAVQAARHLVRVLVELPAGMQPRHDHFRRRDSFLLVYVDRDAPAVVGDGDRAVGVHLHAYRVAVSAESFVDGIVDGLVDHVVQARAVIGVADVHAGPLAHRIQAA